MPKNLIINADDFGMSPEVNAGTKIGIKQGVITSVSVMANMPEFDDAIRFLKKNTHVSVGLHFNITEGQPLILPKLAGNLIREDNNFYHWPSLISRVSFGSIRLLEVERELKAQYEKLQATGLAITHIDSHHHIHLHPHIFKIVSSFADEYKINSLRGNYFNTWNLTLGTWRKPIPTQIVVNTMLFLVNLRHHYRTLPYNVNRFYDINWGKDIGAEDFIKVLEHLPEGTTEFICHLATISETGNKKFLSPRYKALKLLTRPMVKKELLSNGITLIPNHQTVALRVKNPHVAKA